MKKFVLIVLLIVISTIVMGCEKNDGMVVITFNQTITNAPKIEAIEILKGSVIDEPSYVDIYEENGVKYEFLGWFDGIEKHEFNNPFDKDVVLNAKWAINEKINASLIDLSAENENNVFTIIEIIKIESYEGIRIIDEDSAHYSRVFNVFSKYKIRSEHVLFGDNVRQYVYIAGGELTPNIIKFYQRHLFDFELPIEEDYYLRVRTTTIRENDEYFDFELIGHSMIKLETYNPSKVLLDQDEATLSIIKPYLDRIERDKAK
ncbi:MAG: hypothetical protein WC964_00940 [Acholeplasmataceae bacterium]